jgi:hypothetical protein
MIERPTASRCRSRDLASAIALLLDAPADDIEVALELRSDLRRFGAIMICSISGRVALAFSPMTEVSTGTWRQP